MNLYQMINQDLDDQTIDSAQVAAIGFTPSIGRYAQMDDGTRIALNNHDYWLLDDNLEAMNREWKRGIAAMKVR
ncbi:MAG: hypothetical protein DCC51_14665 [Anaerolineae bacterium]|nr:MAG: hypothetical protein DCC51_14665 [Anaerolineae bacterium]